MSSCKKVVWTEGMFLRPQHFQQQDRYLEFFAHQRNLASEPFFWGTRELSLDTAALAVGKLSLLSASGLFPDGTPFSFPDHGAVPEPLALREGAYDQVAYLAFPLRRAGGEEVSFEPMADSLARYTVIDALTHDGNSFAGEAAELQLAQPRVRLVLERDLPDGWVGIGIARVIECRSDRQLVLDRTYIPPVVSCRASAPLLSLLNELRGLVNQRADALSMRLGVPGRGGISEVGEFLMLQMLNRVQQQLAHLCTSPMLHPERFYLVLLQAAGELTTFMPGARRAPEWPGYMHDDLRACLEPLVLHLRAGLSSVLEQNAVQIDLQPRSHGVRIGQVNDAELIRSAQFVLAVHASTPPDQLRAQFPAQVKIGPADKIRDLVNLQLPGVGLRLLPVAPRQIPYHAGYHYFEMDTGIDLWKQLQASGALALHVAGEFPDLELECWAIRGHATSSNAARN